MFNANTDFFDPKPAKNIPKFQTEPQEIETLLPEPDQVEQQEIESFLSEDQGDEQVEASFLTEDEGDEQVEAEQTQVEATVSEVQVFHHSKDVCIDIDGGNIQSCTNTENMVTGISDVVVKIPVVLAEFNVQINLESTISLPEKALEIKEIKKRVKLTQCLLMQEPGVVANPGYLFLRGVIRKNIAYATRDCSNDEGVCGDIRHCTVDVPFNCITSVVFENTLPLPPIANTLTEFEYFRSQELTGPGFAEKDQLLSGDLSEFNQISQEFYNELPYCELICSKIIEFDEFLNRKVPKCSELPLEAKEFSEIEEKMILFLTIKLLQKRQVYIPPATSGFIPQSETILMVVEESITPEPVLASLQEDLPVDLLEKCEDNSQLDITMEILERETDPITSTDTENSPDNTSTVKVTEGADAGIQLEEEPGT